MEEDGVLAEHVKKLGSICRLCGETTELRKTTDKSKFSDVLQKTYGINVSLDVNSIHPQSVCQSCRCHLYRLRSEDSSSKKRRPSLKTLKMFTPHSDICEICGIGEKEEMNRNEDEVFRIVSMFGELGKDEKRNCILKLIKELIPINSLKEHIESVGNQFHHRNLDTLQRFKPEEYFESLNKDILGIILCIAGISEKEVSYEHIFPIIESIYRLSDKQYIGIWSFMQNLVTYSVTKNKQACDIFGTAVPGSKHSYLSAFLSDIESSREAKCPNGDLVFMFDNEQVIGRSWNIHAQNKVKMSIITNVAVTSVSTDCNLQQDESLSPKTWLSSENKEDIVTDMCDIFSSSSATKFSENHYKELYHYLDNCIQQVSEENDFDEGSGKYVDSIDTEVREQENKKSTKVCPNCKQVVDKRKRKCPHCEVNMSAFQKSQPKESSAGQDLDVHVSSNNDNLLFSMHQTSQIMNKKGSIKNRAFQGVTEEQYGHVSSGHQEEQKEIILLDPVFVNPNSIESMIMVLRYIGKKASVSKYEEDKQNTRSWTFVCCDGLPHALVRRLIEEFFVCNVCKEGIVGVENAKKHGEKNHPDANSTFFREFDWVFLLTGEGHYEMNLMKSFMELNWPVFMKAYVEVMGWTSEKAQQSALACSDNHKAWQMINSFHFGTMLELVRPYVIECKIGGNVPSAENFISFAKHQDTNANFMYMFETVCKYTQGIINFRVAVRRNNYNLLRSAKWMTKELFHGRNHPRYQEIEMYESFMSRIVPEKLSIFLQTLCSLSKSGHPSKGQGFDFLLEEENKNVKAWLKRGVPTDQIWLTTCRNYESLKEVKKIVLSYSTHGSDHAGKSGLNLQHEIDAWRFKLRQSNYLDKESNGPLLKSLSGETLSQSLAKFTAEAQRKRSYRLMDMILHQPPPNDPSLHHPVYVLETEKEKYSSLTSMSVAEIDNKILDRIAALDGKFKQAFLDLFDRLIKVKANKKEQHIIFLEELSVIQPEQTSVVDET